MTATTAPTTEQATRIFEVIDRLGGSPTISRLADRAKLANFPRDEVKTVIEVMADNGDLHIDGSTVTVADHDEATTTAEPVITLSKKGKGGGAVWVLADGVRVGYALQQENGSWVAFTLENEPRGTEAPTRKAAGSFLV